MLSRLQRSVSQKCFGENALPLWQLASQHTWYKTVKGVEFARGCDRFSALDFVFPEPGRKVANTERGVSGEMCSSRAFRKFRVGLLAPLPFLHRKRALKKRSHPPPCELNALYGMLFTLQLPPAEVQSILLWGGFAKTVRGMTPPGWLSPLHLPLSGFRWGQRAQAPVVTAACSALLLQREVWVKLAHDAKSIRGSVVSSSFCFTNPPEEKKEENILESCSKLLTL